jgi:hypothetical protein
MGFASQQPPCPSATVLSLQPPSPFVILSEAKGSAVQRDPSWECFRRLVRSIQKTALNLTLFNAKAIGPGSVHPFDTPYLPSGRRFKKWIIAYAPEKYRKIKLPP